MKIVFLKRFFVFKLTLPKKCKKNTWSLFAWRRRYNVYYIGFGSWISTGARRPRWRSVATRAVRAELLDAQSHFDVAVEHFTDCNMKTNEIGRPTISCKRGLGMYELYSEPYPQYSAYMTCRTYRFFLWAFCFQIFVFTTRVLDEPTLSCREHDETWRYHHRQVEENIMNNLLRYTHFRDNNRHRTFSNPEIRFKILEPRKQYYLSGVYAY